MIGTSLHHYQVTAKIGAGGMGEVYRARDGRLGRDVAVKVLPNEFARDGARLNRFEQEAKTLAALNHPNILSIFDTGVHDSTPYLVSELLEGQTLREALGSAAAAPQPLRKASITRCKWRKAWRRHTPKASFIAISNRRTFSSRKSDFQPAIKCCSEVFLAWPCNRCKAANLRNSRMNLASHWIAHRMASTR